MSKIDDNGGLIKDNFENDKKVVVPRGTIIPREGYTGEEWKMRRPSHLVVIDNGHQIRSSPSPSYAQVSRLIDIATKLMDHEDWHGALHNVDAVIAGDRENISAWEIKLKCHAMLDNLDGVKDATRMLYLLHPENPEYAHDRGIICILADRWLQASKIFDRALAQADDPWIAFASGWVHALIGNNDIAIVAFDFCMRLVTKNGANSKKLRNLSIQAKESILNILWGRPISDIAPVFRTMNIYFENEMTIYKVDSEIRPDYQDAKQEES